MNISWSRLWSELQTNLTVSAPYYVFIIVIVAVVLEVGRRKRW